MLRNITILRYDTRYRIDSGSSIRIAIRLDFAHPDGGTDLPTVTVTVYGTATQYVGTWLLPASIVKDEELTAGEPARLTVIKTVYETTIVSTGT